MVDACLSHHSQAVFAIDTIPTIKVLDAAEGARTVAAHVVEKLGLGESYDKSIRAMAGQLQLMADRASVPLPDYSIFPASRAKGITRPLGDNGLSIEHVDQFERDVRPLPVVLAETWRSIGHADFLGTYDGQKTCSWLPLLVLPCLGLVDEYEEFVYDNESDEGFTVPLAANPYDQDCPLEVHLNPGVDAKLTSGEWLVDHLRRASRHAGFLSLKEPHMPPEIAVIASAWEPF